MSEFTRLYPNVHVSKCSLTLNFIGSFGICFRQAPIELVVTANIMVNATKLSVDLGGLQDSNEIHSYTTLTNFSTKSLAMCNVYTDVVGIKQLYHVSPPVRKILYSLKLVLVDYLHVHSDKPWYNYYVYHPYQL